MLATPTAKANQLSPSMKKHPGCVAWWPTPRKFMYKDATTDRGKHNLGEVVGGKLNPTWVEWLMGWPLGFTDLKPLATAKYQRWQRSHGAPSRGDEMVQLGRRFIGHEMQPRYAEISAERLAAAENGQTLQDARAGQMPLFGVTNAK